jgi:hypothetical protein
MLNFFKGYSSDSEISNAISKLMILDGEPSAKLAKSRWLFPEAMMMRMFKSVRCVCSARGCVQYYVVGWVKCASGPLAVHPRIFSSYSSNPFGIFWKLVRAVFGLSVSSCGSAGHALNCLVFSSTRPSWITDWRAVAQCTSTAKPNTLECTIFHCVQDAFLEQIIRHASSGHICCPPPLLRLLKVASTATPARPLGCFASV